MAQAEPTAGDPERLRAFTRCLLRDLRTLEHMIDSGLFAPRAQRVGIEQELFLVDRDGMPAPRSMEILERIGDRHFATELGRYNLEINLDPIEIGGPCLSRLEEDLGRAIATARGAAAAQGADVVMTGILPTLRKSDLTLDNMTPLRRYRELNAATRRLRGSDFELHLSGLDDLHVRHDSVMMESCNTSCQIHVDVTPEAFARFYNAAQVAAAPVLAAAGNSPFLFGKRLWSETRIGVFQQSVDTRPPSHATSDRTARVSFGSGWVGRSILELFEEDVARYRVLLAADAVQDPFEELAAGRTPALEALALHNSTVYRWNRPRFGVTDGRPHLRLESRMLPSGPSVVDEVANTALWLGLLGDLMQSGIDVPGRMEFDTARANFMAAARLGLDATIDWIDGRRWPVRELLGTVLLPAAARGLRGCGLDEADIERYLGVVAQRVETGRTGARWMLRSHAALHGQGTALERLRALVLGMCRREKEGRPVHEWSDARLEEAGDRRRRHEKIGEIMTTDLFTVHQDEVVDLITNVMAWRNIRHVPVENDEHRLVGLVSYRDLLEHMARELPRGVCRPVPVREIMRREPLSVTAETPIAEALQLMRRAGVGCLPVTRADGTLVGIVTEHDFLSLTSHLLCDGASEGQLGYHQP